MTTRSCDALRGKDYRLNLLSNDKRMSASRRVGSSRTNDAIAVEAVIVGPARYELPSYGSSHHLSAVLLQSACMGVGTGKRPQSEYACTIMRSMALRTVEDCPPSMIAPTSLLETPGDRVPLARHDGDRRWYRGLPRQPENDLIDLASARRTPKGRA